MTQPKPLPPLSTLGEVFSYNPETGALTWRVDRPNQVRAGSPAGCPTSHGYIRVRLGSHAMKAHRICYALHHGTDPGPLLVDHINRDRADNRACNLRLVDARGNRANSPQPPPPAPLKRPIAVSRPDGRGTVVCDSVGAAARLLGCARSSVYRYALGQRQHPAGLTVRYLEPT